MPHTFPEFSDCGPRPLPGLAEWQTRLEGWFAPAALAELLGAPQGDVADLALEWLAQGGKRWRPLMAAMVHALLANGRPADIRAVVVAVEAFHKASLVHDDIEDGDTMRYGLPTPHARRGVPIAINLGDYLIGEGYRLLANLDAAPELRLRMLQAAAAGHHRLCLGQGDELAFAARPAPLDVAAYEGLAADKTGAAFEVALALGAITAAADNATIAALGNFSRALGIAYQIHDDLADAGLSGGDWRARRPSILLALACGSGEPAVAAAVAELIAAPDCTAAQRLVPPLATAVTAAGLPARALQLAERHLRVAERALADLPHPHLACLLRGLAARLLEATA